MGGGNQEPKILEDVNCLNEYDENGKQRKQHERVYDTNGLMTTLCSGQSGRFNIAEPKILAMRGREVSVLTPKRTEYGKAIRKEYESGNLDESRHNIQQLEPRDDGITNTLTSVQKDNLVLEPLALDEQNNCIRYDGTVGTLTTDGSTPKHNNRVIEPQIFDLYNHAEIKNGVCGTITANGNTSSTHCGTFGILNNQRIRKLTPKECLRLMGWHDTEIDKIKACGMSDSQQYRQAGNGIVVNVLEAIFTNLFLKETAEHEINAQNYIAVNQIQMTDAFKIAESAKR
jgi:site-specific DNA-cytosine methylase